MSPRPFLLVLLAAMPWALLAQEAPAFSRAALESHFAEISAADSLPITEVATYTVPMGEGVVFLRNGYAQSALVNGDAWPPPGPEVRPTSVTVVFTKYPRHRDFWLTDYHFLLAERLKALFALDPRLNSASVRFSLLLQTDCENEFEAHQLVHGIEVRYEPIALPDSAAADKKVVSVSSTSGYARSLRQLMTRDGYVMDSTVWHAIDTAENWQRATVVVDWTASMLGHGSEALLWQLMHPDSNRVERFIFFNDGNRTADRKKIIGHTGGVYEAPASSPAKLVKLAKKVSRNGNGGDAPENDVEALYAAQIGATGPLVLVADNQSCMRDFELIATINRPVHVLLCRTEHGINHQYINLARFTGGSITTADGHYDFRKLGDSFELEGVSYGLTMGGWVMPISRDENYFVGCNRYYKVQLHRQGKSRSKKWKDPPCYSFD